MLSVPRSTLLPSTRDRPRLLDRVVNSVPAMISGHPYETEALDEQRSEQGRWLNLLRGHWRIGMELSTPIPFGGQTPSVETERAFRAAAEPLITQHIEWLRSAEIDRRNQLLETAAPPDALDDHQMQVVYGALRSAMIEKSADVEFDETAIRELRVLLEAAEHYQPTFDGEG